MDQTPVVLGVDDDQMSLELLSNYLAGTGCLFLAVGSGDAALELIARRRPDLVLLDAMMPGPDGFEVCRSIRSDPANRLMPVVMVTSLSSVADRTRALEAGADDFLTKPVDRTELMARVLTLINTKKIHEHLREGEQVTAAFARIVATKEGRWHAHVERVARAARALGDAAGLSSTTLDVLYFGGLVHDIGKVAVPDSVLLKPGPLTDDEVAVVRRHVAIGVDIVGELRSAPDVIPVIRHHHERFDGSGYPDGLRCSAIPIAAMIVSICDAYDAMTSDRPYRSAMPNALAIAELRDGSGGQFDPELVGLFLERVMQAPASPADSRNPVGR